MHTKTTARIATWHHLLLLLRHLSRRSWEELEQRCMCYRLFRGSKAKIRETCFSSRCSSPPSIGLGIWWIPRAKNIRRDQWRISEFRARLESATLQLTFLSLGAQHMSIVGNTPRIHNLHTSPQMRLPSQRRMRPLYFSAFV